VTFVTLSVCGSVHDVKGKRLELATPNLVHIIPYGSRSASVDPEVKGQGPSHTVTFARLLVKCAAAAAGVGLDVVRLLQFLVHVYRNEKAGIPVEFLQVLDACVEIPQCGLIRSLNVHVTGAVCVWEYHKQWSDLGGSTRSCSTSHQ